MENVNGMKKADKIKNINNINTEKTNNKQRIILLDTLRGSLLILVILFHLLYDLNMIFGVELKIMEGKGIYVFRDCFVSLLIFLSGVCCNLSRSNIKRGFKTFGCALLISAVTGIVMPDEFVLFGILHFFGTAMILYGLFQKVLEKVNKLVGSIIMLLLFIAAFNIYYADISSVLGSGVYTGILKYALFIAGFDTECFSSDYYPLMPWIFMFFAGGFAGRGIKEKKLPDFFYVDLCRPITWIGRHTLWIYLIHQPVMYGILYLFFAI